jgi:hypothetical protein
MERKAVEVIKFGSTKPESYTAFEVNLFPAPMTTINPINNFQQSSEMKGSSKNK